MIADARPEEAPHTNDLIVREFRLIDGKSVPFHANMRLGHRRLLAPDSGAVCSRALSGALCGKLRLDKRWVSNLFAVAIAADRAARQPSGAATVTYAGLLRALAKDDTKRLAAGSEKVGFFGNAAGSAALQMEKRMESRLSRVAGGLEKRLSKVDRLRSRTGPGARTAAGAGPCGGRPDRRRLKGADRGADDARPGGARPDDAEPEDRRMDRLTEAGARKQEAVAEAASASAEAPASAQHLWATGRIMIGFLQVLTSVLVSMPDVGFPEELLGLLRWMTFVNLDVSWLLGLLPSLGVSPCTLGRAENVHAAQLLMVPFCGAFVVAPAYALAAAYKRRRPTARMSLSSARASAMQAFQTFFFLVYAGITARTFASMSAPHSAAERSLAVASLLFVVVGVPLGTLVLMLRASHLLVHEDHMRPWERRDLLTNHEHHRHTRMYGPLFRHYERKYWYFEFVEMARKVVLIGGPQLVPGATAKCGFALAISCAHLALLATTSPFKEDADDVLQQLLGATTCAVFAVGLARSMGADGAASSAVGWALNASILVQMVLFVAIFLYVFPCFRRAVADPVLRRLGPVASVVRRLRRGSGGEDPRAREPAPTFPTHTTFEAYWSTGDKAWVNDSTGDVLTQRPRVHRAEAFARLEERRDGKRGKEDAGSNARVCGRSCRLASSGLGSSSSSSKVAPTAVDADDAWEHGLLLVDVPAGARVGAMLQTLTSVPGFPGELEVTSTVAGGLSERCGVAPGMRMIGLNGQEASSIPSELALATLADLSARRVLVFSKWKLRWSAARASAHWIWASMETRAGKDDCHVLWEDPDPPSSASLAAAAAARAAASGADAALVSASFCEQLCD
jgi:hypothetical protein